MVVYVDDFLIAGSTEVVDATLKKVHRHIGSLATLSGWHPKVKSL